MSCAERTRFFARHRRILPRRSSTAARDDGVVHRRSSGVDTGSGRFVRKCRSPHRRTTSTRRARGSRSAPRRGCVATGGCAGRSAGCTTSTSGVYGVRKVWRQLRREGVTVARCTVARLMRRLGLQGAVRGRRAKTTQSVVQGERPDDRVNREFKVNRPNALWVSDLTYVATWRGVRLHGLRHRRLCAAHRRLAGVAFTAHGFGPRCPRTGPS